MTDLPSARGADILSEWRHPNAGPTDQPEPPKTDDELTDEELALGAAYERAKDIAAQVYQLQIRDEARRRVRAEERATQPRPERLKLADFLDIDYGLPTYRITDLWPTGGRVLLTAQWKAGKTTLVGNVIRSLVDGDPFLDRFPVTPGAHVVLIDDELNEATLQTWLRDQDIQNTAQVSVISLRGRVATFDITDPDVRAEWAQLLTGADVIIFDCLRPVLDALGLDENHEAGRFLVAFDTLLADAGASEAMIVHHMGHHGERSRGDSRLQDWPDALWKLVRDKDEEDDELDNPTGSRYFSAFGRDVDVRQAELVYDQPTRHLTLGDNAMTRTQATSHRRIVKADEAVMAAVVARPGMTKTSLYRACSDEYGVGRKDVLQGAVERLVQRGHIVRQVQGNSHRHYPGTPLEQLAVDPGPDPTQNDPNVPGERMGTMGTTIDPNNPTRSPHPQALVPAALKGGNMQNDPSTFPPKNGNVPTCPDCGWPLDHDGHRAYCEDPR